MEGAAIYLTCDRLSVPVPQVPTRVPPLPERSTSLLNESFGGANDVIYAELRKMTQAWLGRGPEVSSSQAPRSPWDGSPNRPGAGHLDPGPTASPTSQGLLLPPSSEAPGPSAATQSQGSPWGSKGSSADTYELIPTAGLLHAPDEEDGTYEQIPVCWGGPTWPPYPGAGPTYGQRSRPMDWGCERGPGAPEPRNTYEQVPAARTKDSGRTHKVGPVGGAAPGGRRCPWPSGRGQPPGAPTAAQRG